MSQWQKLFSEVQMVPHLLVGLMSGTSADGIDAALVRFRADKESPAELVAFASVPFSMELQHRILQVCQGVGNAETISRLSVELAEAYSEAVVAVCAEANILVDSVCAIGCHGQTVSHTPHGSFPATLQIGDAATLAQKTQLPVVSHFRNADVALQGQGAPLVPYADWFLFQHPTKNRAIQNIGGIANVTYLPAGGNVEAICGFDTGPGNMLIDFMARWATEGRQQFDINGNIARLGSVDNSLLNWLFEHPFLAALPPKSAGREEFGTTLANNVKQFANRTRMRPADVMATLTAFTAFSIADAYVRFLPSLPDEVIVAGGGARNPVLMQFLTEKLLPISVRTSADLGINVAAREAMAFAILANETLQGRPSNLPAVTGAIRPAILGSVTLPT